MKYNLLIFLGILFISLESITRTYSPGVAIRIIKNQQSTQAEVEQAVKDVSPEWKKMHSDVITDALKRFKPFKAEKQIKATSVQKLFTKDAEVSLGLQNQAPLSEVATPLKAVVPEFELYNTQFLKRKKDVRRLLLSREGFSEVVIKKTSKIFSSILYKTVPHARYAFVLVDGVKQKSF